MAFVDTNQQDTIPTTTGILRGGPLVAGIEVSALLSEAHSLTAQTTQQALEQGSIVSDHVIIAPYSVTITFEVSNAGEGPTIAKDVFETFKEMLEKRELVELMTEHYIYDNMVLTGINPVHSAPYRGRLQCTATLQRVNQIKLQIVGREEKNMKGPKKPAAAEQNAGQQNPVDVSKSNAAAIQDNAQKGRDWAGYQNPYKK